MSKQKKELKIVQIGQVNWQDHYELADNMDWFFLKPEDIDDFVAGEVAKKEAYQEEQDMLAKLVEEGETNLPKAKHKPPVKYTALLLTQEEYPESLADLATYFDAYEVFYNQEYIPTNAWTKELLYRKMAHLTDMSDPQALLDRLSKALFKGQYGAKMPITDLRISPSFTGQINYEGNRHLILEGDYGSDYQQIANFNYNIPFYKDSAQDLFFDHLSGDGVETKICVQLIQEGSLSTIVDEWEFDGQDRLSEYHINSNHSGYLVISLFAKGQGKLKIGPCHYRYSRCGFGSFVLGGQRFVDDYQDEFMAYFHPQDFKPPLCVYFSGWRSAEGFEGYGMMKAMGTPFLLICDPRLSGGSFYMGSESFERAVSDLIQEKLDFLGFDRSQLILSGLSMGTFGATYHGTKLNPHAIIIGKPVFSLGEVALKEKIVRPGGFKTSLDLLRLFSDRYDEVGAATLDNYFWSQFEGANFTNTKFVVSYMQDEDYDATAFRKILDYTKADSSIKVLMKGIPGRHNDNSDPQIKWFITQYYNVLKNDFGRKF